MNLMIVTLRRLCARHAREKKRECDQKGQHCVRPSEPAAIDGHELGSVPNQPKRRLMKLMITAIDAPHSRQDDATRQASRQGSRQTHAMVSPEM
ncbi:hypothetical protein [Rhizobium bangladeshense]|uniref:hypothetical protein n=1 Tax=Rhizobium bangladeshense TaxID=1138189 RepID=UPI001C8FE9D0|nr:hypothetical protein [Rhizobium bangladeshense]MBY3598725.1 hypothetical protein [Rhizobium bangladeshense]